jgi:hypothetical protein
MFVDNPTSEASLYEGAMNKMAAAAKRTDLLDRANSHTKDILTKMLTDMGFEHVEVRFQLNSTSI